MVNGAMTGSATPAESNVLPQAAPDRWSVVAALLLSALYVWVLVWLAVAVVAPYLVLRWQPLVITSGSMAPLIRDGDVILIARPGTPVTAGQVITYDDPPHPGALNTHRVVSVEPDGSYRTRGDANPSVDSTPIPAEAVVGRGRLLVPMVGLPLRWLSENPVLFAVWAAATIAAGLVVIGPRGHATRTDPPDARPDPPATSRPGRRTSPTTTALAVVLALTSAGSSIMERTTAALTAQTDTTANDFRAAAPLSPPSNLTAGQTCSGSIPTADLSWTATPDTWADGYQLTRDSDPPQTIAGRTTTTAIDGPLTNGTAYSWQLAATAGPWTSSSINVTLTPECATPPTHVASTSFNSFGGSVSLTVPETTQTGDLLITFTGTDDPNVTPPGGWNLLRADNHSGPGAYTRVYWRLATAGDPGTSYTWTGQGSSSGGGAAMVVYRGVDQTTPFDAHGGATYSDSTSLSAPSITTTVTDTRLIALYYHEAGSGDSATITPPPTMSEVFEGQSSTRTIEIADEEFAASGSTGGRTATATQADDGIGVLVAVRPG